MRSSPEGDRKALWSPPQRRNPRINTRKQYERKLNSIAKRVSRGSKTLRGCRAEPCRSPEAEPLASPLENLQIPLAKRGKCGYNEWECARMGTAQDKPWKASRGGCEPGQDCLMANHPGARFSEATRAERAERVGKDGFSRYRESRCVRLHRADRHRACQVGWYRG